MTRFPTAAALASWAGVAPGNNESAGKNLSGATTGLEEESGPSRAMASARSAAALVRP